jgi:hypothetical protein
MGGTNRNALNVRYSSPTSLSFIADRRSPPAASRKLESENSSSVMSLVSLSLPLSPSGEAIEAWRTKVERMWRTRSTVLHHNKDEGKQEKQIRQRRSEDDRPCQPGHDQARDSSRRLTKPSSALRHYTAPGLLS